MSDVSFDTLEMAQKLQASGMNRDMAFGVIDVVAAGMRGMATGIIGPKASACLQPVLRADLSRRNFSVQLAFMTAMWVWATVLGFSYLLPHH